ncbi:SAM-dependent methyltransferase [Dokdonella sp.]|uniref:class I SAM-dependent methyltransferase n=1 Tax=Dokdonella sp. TaxID=2291710 RepID=UPI0025B837CF|nr:SAM-dependent methyltransferase [Dokdonella sp.]MBX3691828.1 SAM-dependent methyltransferase [Dokdonella sp.]
MSIALPPPDADERAHSARLVALLREEIERQGPMPFSRFMERCLYAPGLGYYSAGRTKFGAAGDFVTAPELGHLFAASLADAFAPALHAAGNEACFVELGGGSGAFAENALRAWMDAGELPARYRILEPSADLRERQRERLAAVLPAEVFARVDWLERPPEDAWRGVLFANEVVDALPATRFALRDGEVFEEHVAVVDDAFVIVDRPADALVTAAVRHLERDLGESFADGYRSEVLPQLPYWMQAVLGSLEAGLAVFIDYGYPRRVCYHAQRSDGTLVCHYRHRAHADALLWPGLQDITASVDFTALAEAGNAAGFGVAGYARQGAFLLATGLEARFVAACAQADEVTRYRLAQEVKRLTLPGEMGERFQLMLFARDLPIEALPQGLAAIDERRRL